MQWTYIVRNRRRWSILPDLKRQQAVDAAALLRGLGAHFCPKIWLLSSRCCSGDFSSANADDKSSPTAHLERLRSSGVSSEPDAPTSVVSI